MPPTQATTSVPDPSSHKWHTLAATFITLFIIILLLASITTAALYHHHHHHHKKPTTTHNKTKAPKNPHPFGSEPWLRHEHSRLPQPSRDALRIADLEAQNDLLAQRADVLEAMAGLVERRNGDLGRELAALRMDPPPPAALVVPDPEVLRRVMEEVHRPLPGRRAGQGLGSGTGTGMVKDGEGEGEGNAPAGVAAVNGGTGHRPSVESDYNPNTNPAGRVTPSGTENHRDTTCSFDTTKAVVTIDQPMSPLALDLALDLAAGPDRSTPPSSVTSDLSDDSASQQQHVSDEDEVDDPAAGVYEMREFV